MDRRATLLDSKIGPSLPQHRYTPPTLSKPGAPVVLRSLPMPFRNGSGTGRRSAVSIASGPVTPIGHNPLVPTAVFAWQGGIRRTRQPLHADPHARAPERQN